MLFLSFLLREERGGDDDDKHDMTLHISPAPPFCLSQSPIPLLSPLSLSIPCLFSKILPHLPPLSLPAMPVTPVTQEDQGSVDYGRIHMRHETGLLEDRTLRHETDMALLTVA